jgi:prolyl-tRNA editing enzyme YbaK/EbsC (Cys-tRNA(Pro) deacylase)
MASPEQVLEHTGYRIGGVPPVAHAKAFRVLLDRALLQYDVVYAAAGSPLAIFPTSPNRLIEISGAELVDVSEAQ